MVDSAGVCYNSHVMGSVLVGLNGYSIKCGKIYNASLTPGGGAYLLFFIILCNCSAAAVQLRSDTQTFGSVRIHEHGERR